MYIYPYGKRGEVLVCKHCEQIPKQRGLSFGNKTKLNICLPPLLTKERGSFDLSKRGEVEIRGVSSHVRVSEGTLTNKIYIKPLGI